ncbi:DUF5110 domain-containing protein [Aliikangiella coralliicola]|uniref:DUF5110 domain-containing protein n=2 Tax=Aliikangiella coralliicola TaxID=2592383 RepID=A0A545UK84_9GAMM|nr:DUF5110 domain-containing protein [Aliikangiella coralliicola]
MLALTSCVTSRQSSEYVSHSMENGVLVVETSRGKIQLTALPGDSIEVHHMENGVKQLPSFAISETSRSEKGELQEKNNQLFFRNGNLEAVINKKNFEIRFFRGAELISRQIAYFHTDKNLGFNFELTDKEKIMGGGQRVLGMDRRGHRMPLYNRAHYGYTTESNQMYYSLPAIMSDKKYMIVFDNSASGFLDIGKTNKDVLSFEAVGGRTAYIVSTAKNFPKLINNYVELTGKQPLPPRWAFGNYASRFGYKTEKQVRETVDKFIQEDFPLDTVILDLYWFGPDIKGHVGNLDWDRSAFPTPEKMIDDLKQKGVKTIAITEPFILSSSKNWQEAVDNKVIAKDEKGEPYRYDFYFGNTGLVDVFDKNAQQWFWQHYQKLFEQGTAGTWGDLGEPEVHPDDILHYFSAAERNVRGDEIHNAYGHQWAKMVYENQREFQPQTRPFIMMRSGFAGSQRFGIIPWTGDVSRSWGGLKPQVELSLQMGLFGLAYTHSDLGGFAGGTTFDKELYIRWLQYGVFQPVYRPHAQDNIAPEPVFHDKETKDIIREFVKLRYQMLPYIYTMAYQNSTTGMPLMRPLFFSDESNLDLIDNKTSYLWGDSLLISPVVEPGITSQSLSLPTGVWFDYWNGTKYQGSQTVDIPVDLKKIPVLVKAGAFLPMIESIQSTKDYSSGNLILHYYSDDSASESKGMMYEDDGESFDSIQSGAHELLRFKAKNQRKHLEIEIKREGKGYRTMPASRKVSLVIHNWNRKPESIEFNDEEVPADQFTYDSALNQLEVSIVWNHEKSLLVIK